MHLDIDVDRLLQAVELVGPFERVLQLMLEQAGLRCMPGIRSKRLAHRAVCAPAIPPHVRWPLAILRHVLETEPIATYPLAEVHVRLESIRRLQEQIELDRRIFHYQMLTRYQMLAWRPSSMVGLITGI